MNPESVGFFLQIETDPTDWGVNGTPDALAAQLEQAAGPVAVAVWNPLPGQLLVSPRAAFAWLGAPGGSHPTDLPEDATSVIYLPSLSPATPTSGYALDPSETLAGLQDQIAAAMANEERIIVKLVDGQLVLNGATLAFVVLGQVPA